MESKQRKWLDRPNTRAKASIGIGHFDKMLRLGASKRICWLELFHVYRRDSSVESQVGFLMLFMQK